MTASTLISDDLLRRLVGVGQVDLVVGVPTLNHASTIGEVVRAVHTCFLRYFARQRTVLIHSDGGSTDDTLAIVRDCGIDDRDNVKVSHALRTVHRISTAYQATAGLGAANGLILRAADLLQARAVVVVDPDLGNVMPERVAALARPIVYDGFDFVAPVYDRLPFEGLLVTQFLRPLVGGLFSRRISEPLAREFGCSGRFASAWTEDSPETNGARDAGGLWLTTQALSGPFKAGQVPLGRRVLAATRMQPALADVFEQIVGDAFQALEVHARYWTTAVGEALPDIGERPPHVESDPAPRPAQDGERLIASFASDVRNLDEILRAVLQPDSFASIVAAANAPTPDYPGPLWAETVADFVVARHRGVMRRDHVVQALMPLYSARAGSFLRAYGAAPADIADAALAALCADFDRIKNHVVERWTTTNERTP